MPVIGNISCKEATYLVSKREEGKLTIRERLKLYFHFRICSFCKLFARQSKYMGQQTAKLEEQMDEVKMEHKDKEQIRKEINK